jgi:hypothetical protein
MHIITGLLVSTLLGLRKKRQQGEEARDPESPLLKAPSIISVVHSLPGRTRFRVPSLVGRDQTAAQLEDALARIEPVDCAAVNATSGTVLLEYGDDVQPDLLAAALIRLLGLEEELKKDVHPAAVTELHSFGRSLNRAVYEKTGGALDARTVLFVALAIFGAQKIVKQGLAAMPAGFTLLWWAGNGLLRGSHFDE